VGDYCAAVYDEQIIARSRTRVQAQPFLWFPASCFSEIAGRAPHPDANFGRTKGSRQFDDFGAAFRRHISAVIGATTAMAQKKSRRFRRL